MESVRKLTATGVALTAGAVLAWSPPAAEVPYGGAPRDVCESPEALPLSKDFCTDLPPYAALEYSSQSTKAWYVGRLLFRNQRVVFEIDSLPPAQQAAVQGIAQDAAGAYLVRTHVNAVNVFATRGKDYAAYHDEIKSPYLTFSATEDPYGRELFLTTGSVIAAGVHESAHAMYASWHDKAARDPQTAQLLNEAKQLFGKERQHVLEDFRLQYGNVATSELHKLAQRVHEGRPKLASAATRLAAQFAQPHGLDVLAASNIKLDVNEMINGESSEAQYPEASVLNRLLRAFAETRYTFTDESVVLYGVFKRDTAGNPGNTLNERLTSQFVTAHFNAPEVYRRIATLPLERRELAIRMLEVQQVLIQRNDPGLLGASGVPELTTLLGKE